jgi:NADH dehydrogenase [ubiquinone] 1 alpha subcomplex assembly factor 2
MIFLSRGKKRARRWFTHVSGGHVDHRGTPDTAGFDNELPAEWESWLRHRRDDPPTESQVLQGYALADLKKVKTYNI